MNGMLQSFSWGEYFTLVIILTVVYYVSILFLYYRREVKDFFKGGYSRNQISRQYKEKVINGITSNIHGISTTPMQQLQGDHTDAQTFYPFDSEQDPASSTPLQDKYSDPDTSMLFPYVHELMDEIGQVLKTASNKNYIKEELITALQMKISKYPMLEDTAFRGTVSSFIATESRKACSVFLSEDELERLWKKGK